MGNFKQDGSMIRYVHYIKFTLVAEGKTVTGGKTKQLLRKLLQNTRKKYYRPKYSKDSTLLQMVSDLLGYSG